MALTNPNYNALPKLANIQGFWRMEEESDKRDDLSDNENDLADINTVLYDTGKIGNAASFVAGNSECLTIADGSQNGLDITGEITISAWIKPDTIDDRAIVAKHYWSGNQMAYSLVLASSKLRFNLSPDGSSETPLNSTDNISTAAFSHIVATLNQSDDKMRIYINGSLNCTPASYTGNIHNSSAEFAIGIANNRASSKYDGLIDEVIIWDTCLTAGEVAQVYAITTADMYKKAGGGFFIFLAEAFEKHNKLWRPKLAIPKLGYQI